MKVLTNTLFTFILLTSGLYAETDESVFYNEMSVLGMLAIVLVPVFIFPSLVAAMYASVFFAFGEKEKFELDLEAIGGEWQTWLLIFFAILAIIVSIILPVIASVILLSPVVFIAIPVIVAIAIAAVIFNLRGPRA